MAVRTVISHYFAFLQTLDEKKIELDFFLSDM